MPCTTVSSTSGLTLTPAGSVNPDNNDDSLLDNTFDESEESKESASLTTSTAAAIDFDFDRFQAGGRGAQRHENVALPIFSFLSFVLPLLFFAIFF